MSTEDLVLFRFCAWCSNPSVTMVQVTEGEWPACQHHADALADMNARIASSEAALAAANADIDAEREKQVATMTRSFGRTLRRYGEGRISYETAMAELRSAVP